MLNGNVITVNDTDYMVLETIDYQGKKYIFTNEIKEEEPTDDYYIFNINNSEVTKIVEEELLNKLIEEFKTLLAKAYNELEDN